MPMLCDDLTELSHGYMWIYCSSSTQVFSAYACLWKDMTYAELSMDKFLVVSCTCIPRKCNIVKYNFISQHRKITSEFAWINERLADRWKGITAFIQMHTSIEFNETPGSQSKCTQGDSVNVVSSGLSVCQTLPRSINIHVLWREFSREVTWPWATTYQLAVNNSSSESLRESILCHLLVWPVHH